MPAVPAVPDVPSLIGGALCLDFVNTVDPRHATDRREYLDSYPALVGWGRRAGAIDASTGERLLKAAATDPREARRVLQRAITLREALYPIFARAINGQPPAPDDLDTLHGELTGAMTHIRVHWAPTGFTRGWDDDEHRLDRVLWPVIQSAVDLLVCGPLGRVRECLGDGNCGWLFLDLSKNASRRWCEMRTCGNRAKVRRYYARTRDDLAAW
jgi:predicted RNA-binding Zn ribbon-like protein